MGDRIDGGGGCLLVERGGGDSFDASAIADVADGAAAASQRGRETSDGAEFLSQVNGLAGLDPIPTHERRILDGWAC